MNRCSAMISPALWSQFLHSDRIIPEHVWHLSDVIRREVVKGQDTGLGAVVLVSMPPGHIKSDTASVHTPEWFLENWPAKNVGVASYGQRKAAEWGRKIRNDIKQNPEKFSVRLAEDSKAKDQFNTQKDGGLLCTGVGGAFTGFRAHLLVVDDPVKDEEEAQSEVMREKVWEWFRTVAFTRCWPEAVKLVVMTRWHEDDLIGKVEQLYRDGDDENTAKYPLVIVRFPAIAEDEDVLGRQPGEPLWPEGGYGLEWAESTIAFVGSLNWAKMYQQRPSPKGGGMFKAKYFRYWHRLQDGYELDTDAGKVRYSEAEVFKIQTIDTAMTEKTTSDFCVCMTLGITKGMEILVLDISRERMDVPEQWPWALRQRAKWGNILNWRWQGVESKNSGITMLQLAKREGVPLRELEAETDKVTRATPASVAYEQGRVFHKAGAPWQEDFESELKNFPNGAHDDQVDCIAHGVRSIQPRRRMLSGNGTTFQQPRDPLSGIAVAGGAR